MEIPQGNFLCSYFYLKQTKCLDVLVLFPLLQNQRTRGWNRSCPVGSAGTSGGGEEAGKGGRRVNIVQKVCTHACKFNNDTNFNYSMNEGEDKGQRWRE
jgi:hypothetical protein